MEGRQGPKKEGNAIDTAGPSRPEGGEKRNSNQPGGPGPPGGRGWPRPGRRRQGRCCGCRPWWFAPIAGLMARGARRGSRFARSGERDRTDGQAEPPQRVPACRYQAPLRQRRITTKRRMTSITLPGDPAIVPIRGDKSHKVRQTNDHRDPSRHRNPATTRTPAIASEGRFKRSENLIAQRAARRAGAMPAIARVSRRWRAVKARRRREMQTKPDRLGGPSRHPPRW
jgi:hypothetical protein